jgi:hypothetical protein
MVYLSGMVKASRLGGSDAALCMYSDYTYMQFSGVLTCSGRGVRLKLYVRREIESRIVISYT